MVAKVEKTPAINQIGLNVNIHYLKQNEIGILSCTKCFYVAQKCIRDKSTQKPEVKEQVHWDAFIPFA